MNIVVYYNDETGSDTLQFDNIKRVEIDPTGVLTVHYSVVAHSFAPHEWFRIEKEEDDG